MPTTSAATESVNKFSDEDENEDEGYDSFIDESDGVFTTESADEVVAAAVNPVADTKSVTKVVDTEEAKEADMKSAAKEEAAKDAKEDPLGIEVLDNGKTTELNVGDKSSMEITSKNIIAKPDDKGALDTESFDADLAAAMAEGLKSQTSD